MLRPRNGCLGTFKILGWVFIDLLPASTSGLYLISPSISSVSEAFIHSNNFPDGLAHPTLGFSCMAVNPFPILAVSLINIMSGGSHQVICHVDVLHGHMTTLYVKFGTGNQKHMDVEPYLSRCGRTRATVRQPHIHILLIHGLHKSLHH